MRLEQPDSTEIYRAVFSLFHSCFNEFNSSQQLSFLIKHFVKRDLLYCVLYLQLEIIRIDHIFFLT